MACVGDANAVLLLRVLYSFFLFRARLMLLKCAIANGRSVCSSVTLVTLCHTRLSHSWSTPTRLKIFKYISHHVTERCL